MQKTLFYRNEIFQNIFLPKAVIIPLHSIILTVLYSCNECFKQHILPDLLPAIVLDVVVVQGRLLEGAVHQVRVPVAVLND